MLIRLLGALDLISALTFLLLIFGITPWISLTLFCAGLLLLKGGVFTLLGDPGSALDIIASLTLMFSLFLTPWAALLWILSLILLAKGVASFL